MNWKLIFMLSLLGLAMAFATVYAIPSDVEPFLWLVIFVFCAWIIAQKCSPKYFLHGLMVGVINSVWITIAHVLLFDTYLANHPQEAIMMEKMPIPDSPRLMMLITGPVIGVISGVILGLFALIASKMIRKQSGSNISGNGNI